MYSIGLLVLYIMCESRELFYRIRDNYVKPEEKWLAKLRREEEVIAFVMDMINLKLNVQDARQQWDEISEYIDYLLSKSRIEKEYEIPIWSTSLFIQDNMDKNSVNMADASLLDEYV